MTAGIFATISVVALASFAWPFVVPASGDLAETWTMVIVCLLVPVLAVIAVIVAERGVTGRPDAAKFVAMLGLLAAAGAVVRLFGSAAGGIEAVFVILIIGGAVYGPRFGFLLGAATIGVSSLALGLLGPWVGFQMFAAAWVGAGAGLVSRAVARGTRRQAARARRWIELAALCTFGILAAYVYGALLNLWFWPFAVGGQTSISYVAGGDAATNFSRFVVYTLVTSTLTWDTVRAVTTVIGIAVLGPAIIAGLRRVKLSR